MHHYRLTPPQLPALPEQPVMDKIVNESAYAVCKEDFDQVTGLYNVAKNLYGSVQKSIEKVNGLQQKQTTYIKSAPEPEVKRLLKFREKQEKFKGEMDANIQVYTNHLQKFQRAYDALVKDGCGARKRQTELSAINVDLEKKINKEDAEYIFENKTDHAGDFLGLRSRVDRVEDRLDAYFVSTRMGYAKVFDEPSTQGVYLAAEAPVSGSVNLGLAGLLGGRSFRPHTSTSTVASADGQVDLITKTTNERDDFSWGVGAGGTIYPLSEAGIHLDTLVVWKEQKVRREIVSELQQNGRMMPGSRSQPYVQANGHQQWRLAPAVGVVIAPVGGLEVFGNLRGYVDGDRGDNLVTNFGIEAGLGYRFGI